MNYKRICCTMQLRTALLYHATTNGLPFLVLCRCSIVCTQPCLSSPATASMKAPCRMVSQPMSVFSMASTFRGPSLTSPCCSMCSLVRKKSVSLAPPISTAQVCSSLYLLQCHTLPSMRSVAVRLMPRLQPHPRCFLCSGQQYHFVACLAFMSQCRGMYLGLVNNT